MKNIFIFIFSIFACFTQFQFIDAARKGRRDFSRGKMHNCEIMRQQLNEQKRTARKKKNGSWHKKKKLANSSALQSKEFLQSNNNSNIPQHEQELSFISDNHSEKIAALLSAASKKTSIKENWDDASDDELDENKGH